MVPNLSKAGYSFKGAHEYYAHDKPGYDHELVMTSDRVAWVTMRNLMTDDPKVATRIMIATALSADDLKAQAGVANTGRKSAAHVQTLSLAWHPDETVSREEMEAAADEVMELLEVHDRQVVIWAHSDTAHPHIHLVINRVCMHTGKMAGLSNAKYKLDEWARKYEAKHKLIVTPRRVAKFERREAARKKFSPDDRKAYVGARRKEVAATSERPQNDRWGRAQAAEARRSLDDAEAALERRNAAEAALQAAATQLEASKGQQVNRTYRFTKRTEAEKQALEAEFWAEQEAEWDLIPPFAADDDALDDDAGTHDAARSKPATSPALPFATRLQEHERRVSIIIEQKVTEFTTALPRWLTSVEGLRAMFAELRTVAVTFGARLRDTLRDLAVDQLASLGAPRMADIRRDTSRIRAEARQMERKTDKLRAEAAVVAEAEANRLSAGSAIVEAEQSEQSKPAPQPSGPTPF
jgi:Relaxase/Mobilisation nuclease domain